MKKSLAPLIVLLLFVCSALAQSENKQQGENNCPDVELSVIGPPTAVKPGEQMRFNAIIEGEVDGIKYEWTVKNAKLIQGQETSSVVVGTTENTYEAIVVTVKADLGNGCVLEASDSGMIGDPPIPTLIDEFGNLTDGNVKARIEAFEIELQNNRQSQGYIINYGSKKDVARRERVIRNAINHRGFDVSRIIFVSGGIEKTIRTRLWIVPAGADASSIN